MSFVPFIGLTGTFELKAPYNKMLAPNVLYTVRSIRTLNDILAAGENPYELYYKSMDIEKAVYENDLSNNVIVLGLQAGSGEWIYLPQTYVIQAPNNSGVVYSSIVLGVSLGPIPDEYSLEALKAEMATLVSNVLGVVPTVKGVLVAQPVMLSYEQHAQLETARAAKKVVNETTSAKITRLERELRLERLKTVGLENWITDNKPR